MKKIVMTAIAVFALINSNAQDVKFGVKTGLNLSTFSGDVANVDSKFGFILGGFAEIKLSEKFAFQPELLFSTQGAKSSESYAEIGYSEKMEYNLKANYLNIPLMAKYYANSKLSIQVGPQIGFLMSSKTKVDYTINDAGVIDSGSQTVDTKSSYNSIDFGLNIGAGYDITENIGLDLRYNLGLSNVNKKVDGVDMNVKNSVVQLGVSYKF
ncbi:porin family protein [Flavobacterium sp.]|jgi:opacity protein-like surface antigen|uniref:porin family protein n=1 Tax=Flavobacterium sp. TaxID=239 RepID=UPI0037BF2265